jgi:hypothetical protein
LTDSTPHGPERACSPRSGALWAGRSIGPHPACGKGLRPSSPAGHECGRRASRQMWAPSPTRSAGSILSWVAKGCSKPVLPAAVQAASSAASVGSVRRSAIGASTAVSLCPLATAERSAGPCARSSLSRLSLPGLAMRTRAAAPDAQSHPVAQRGAIVRWSPSSPATAARGPCRSLRRGSPPDSG